MHTSLVLLLSRLPSISRGCWIRLRQASIGLIAAMLMTVPAMAQTLSIKATVGPTLTWGPGTTPMEFSWQRVLVSGLVAEEGYPVARLDRDSGEPISYPFDVSAASGSSWADITLASSGSAFELEVHLEDEWTIPATGSFEFEIQGWIADILIPAYSSGTIFLEARIQGSATPAYAVTGSLEMSDGTRAQTIPGTFTAFGINGMTDFNNSVNASPLHTGPIYFVASVRVDALPPPPPIPEPTRAWMMILGLILFSGWYRVSGRRSRANPTETG